MSSYTYNSSNPYDDSVSYETGIYSPPTSGYIYNNPSTEYNAEAPYNRSAILVGVPPTYFPFNGKDPHLNPKPSLRVPVKNFVVNRYVPTIRSNYRGGPSLVVPLTEFHINGTSDVFKVKSITFSGEAIPGQHVEDAQKLDADGYVELFEILLSDKSTKLYLKMNKEVTWQGNLYESTAIKIDGVAKYADDEVARPKLSLFNPEGVYSSLVDQGQLDAATIIRYRVLKYDIDNNRPVYRRQQWKVSRITGIVGNMISLELRDLMDGQIFSVPGRMFIPPDFPTVGIQ